MSRRNAGWLGVARASVRDLLSRVGRNDGDDLAMFVLLWIDWSGDDDQSGEVPLSSWADLASHYRIPWKRLRQRVERWERLGWVEVERPSNDERAGVIRLIEPIEAVATARRAPTRSGQGSPRPAPRPALAPTHALPSPQPDRVGALRENADNTEHRTLDTEHRLLLPVSDAREASPSRQEEGGASPSEHQDDDAYLALCIQIAGEQYRAHVEERFAATSARDRDALEQIITGGKYRLKGGRASALTLGVFRLRGDTEAPWAKARREALERAEAEQAATLDAVASEADAIEALREAR